MLCTVVPTTAATQYTFDIPISKPNVTDEIAYIEVLYGGGAYCEVAIFNCRIFSEDKFNLDYQIDVYSDSISIYPIFTTSSAGVSYSMTAFWVSTTGNTDFENPTVNTALSLYYPDIVGIHVYGGVKVSGLEDNNIDFTVNYGSDGVAIGQLNTIIAILQNKGNGDIIANQNQNAEDIQQNQNENTDKIIENDKAMQEQEKQEISGSGNDSVDSIISVVPDVGADGIQSSVENLLNGAKYDGTDCKWTFPAIEIPAVEGLFNKITLTQPQEIDLGSWVRKIPEPVLKTIQALCSIGVVLFVLYSFFDLLLYCFTQNKKGSGKGSDDD